MTKHSAGQVPVAAVRVRPMAERDLGAVAVVERASFANGWPATAFAHELANNGLARYVVLERTDELPPQIIGFAGLWLMVDEAHVVTVAVAPAERGKGYGRLLVHALVLLAEAAGMNEATLECRVSNTPARGLYREYGFYEVGTRKAYYADNREDAVIMTTEAFASAPFRTRIEALEQKLEALLPGAIAGMDLAAG
ncbi:MAG: ribosomal protein S18-alanine N-acetyltransferase [Dehalococcoidia bacterium]|nr:ribosomal protein S18-alanine N-acetyltransferase [Dehalococcoidia bacterium]